MSVFDAGPMLCGMGLVFGFAICLVYLVRAFGEIENLYTRLIRLESIVEYQSRDLRDLEDRVDQRGINEKQ